MQVCRGYGRVFLILVVCVIVGAISGCSGAMHSADRDYDQAQDVRVSSVPPDSGPVTITQNLTNNFYLGSVTSENNANQEPSNSTDVDGAVGLNGSTPSLATSGASLLADAASVFKQSQSQVDMVQPPDAIPPPPTTSIPPTTPPPPETGKDDAANGAAFSGSITYPLEAISGNNKKFTWLPKTGAHYGGPVQFVFDGCGDLLVPNAAVSIGADGTGTNYNQAFYFCGTDFKEGAAEWNNNQASIFSPPGCAADSVTMLYNPE